MVFLFVVGKLIVFPQVIQVLRIDAFNRIAGQGGVLHRVPYNLQFSSVILCRNAVNQQDKADNQGDKDEDRCSVFSIDLHASAPFLSSFT